MSEKVNTSLDPGLLLVWLREAEADRDEYRHRWEKASRERMEARLSLRELRDLAEELVAAADQLTGLTFAEAGSDRERAVEHVAGLRMSHAVEAFRTLLVGGDVQEQGTTTDSGDDGSRRQSGGGTDV